MSIGRDQRPRWIARVWSGGIAIVGVNGGSGTFSLVVTEVAEGAGVFVVACCPRGYIIEAAAVGVAPRDKALPAVPAVDGPALADSLGTTIIFSTGVVVITGQAIWSINTPFSGVTGIGGAGVAVVTGNLCPRLADSLAVAVVIYGTFITCITRGSVEFVNAFPGGIVTSAVGAWVAIITVLFLGGLAQSAKTSLP